MPGAGDHGAGLDYSRPCRCSQADHGAEAFKAKGALEESLPLKKLAATLASSQNQEPGAAAGVGAACGFGGQARS